MFFILYNKLKRPQLYYVIFFFRLHGMVREMRIKEEDLLETEYLRDPGYMWLVNQ